MLFFFPLGNCILAVFQWSHLPENGLKNMWPSNTKFLSQYQHYSAVQKWQRSQISWWKLVVNALPGSNTVNLQAWQISCTHWHFQMLMRNAVLESTRLSFKKLVFHGAHAESPADVAFHKLCSKEKNRKKSSAACSQRPCLDQGWILVGLDDFQWPLPASTRPRFCVNQSHSWLHSRKLDCLFM